jgi:hypothetical protein
MRNLGVQHKFIVFTGENRDHSDAPVLTLLRHVFVFLNVGQAIGVPLLVSVVSSGVGKWTFLSRGILLCAISCLPNA